MRRKLNIKPIAVEAAVALVVLLVVGSLLAAQAQEAQDAEGVDSVYIITTQREGLQPDHNALPTCTPTLDTMPCTFTLSRYADYTVCGEYTLGTMRAFYKDVRPYLATHAANSHIVGRCVGTDNMKPGSKRG